MPIRKSDSSSCSVMLMRDIVLTYSPSFAPRRFNVVESCISATSAHAALPRDGSGRNMNMATIGSNMMNLRISGCISMYFRQDDTFRQEE